MSTIPLPGFFGKLPVRGDFLSRRVPATFRSQWEHWLSDLTVAAKDATGETLTDLWFAAPIWRFWLGEAIAPPQGVAGLLIPSCDRVGRLFPFTIIGPVSEMAVNGWMSCAEALLLQALDKNGDPETLDADLAALGPPPAQDDDAAWCRLAAIQSVWQTAGSPVMPPVRLRGRGLPNPGIAAGMVTGQFDLDGTEFWRDEAQHSKNDPGNSKRGCHQDQGASSNDRGGG